MRGVVKKRSGRLLTRAFKLAEKSDCLRQRGGIMNMIESDWN